MNRLVLMTVCPALSVQAFAGEETTPAKTYRSDHSTPFPIVRVPDAPRDGWASETFLAYGITALPTVVLLDRQGKMVSIGGGSGLSQDILRLLQN